MKIGVIGATGNVGSAVVEEALSRSHEVTAVVRNAHKAQDKFGNRVKILEKDALALDFDDLSDFDYVVDAFASPKGYQHLDLATKLISMFRENTHTKLFFIVGASSLSKDGKMQLDEVLKFAAKEPWVDAVVQQVHEYEYLKWIDNVAWTAVSPQTTLVTADKTSYNLGQDDVLTNAAGKSVTSTGNLAAAMLDEIEHPAHAQQRFTVLDD